MQVKWDQVRADLDEQEWEDDERLVFLGSVFSLTPSGKYYTPWAAGNLDPCPGCHGEGVIPRKGKARTAKKAGKRLDRAIAVCRRDPTPRRERQYDMARRAFERSRLTQSCPQCGGCGSREAYLDELFWEKLEAEAEAHGLYITAGEGDPTDIFVGESR